MKNDELSFLESEIQKWISQISREHFNLIMNDHYQENELDRTWTEDHILRGTQIVYNQILVYLELRQLPKYLDIFIEKFSSKISSKAEVMKDGFCHPEGEPELFILDEFSKFLTPFSAFDYSQKSVETVKSLTDVLKETTFIVKNSRATISNETSIYKEVEWVLKLYYPSCRRKNKASFIEQFKTYNPDLLIPELKTAVEYKFVRKDTNIDDFIDQVKVDSMNYKGDMRYENFIAVICIEDKAIATLESIKSSWNSKEFKHNWELIVVFL